MSARTWVWGAIVMTATSVGANEKLSLKVSPVFSFAPANLVINTRVEPDADNREMDVVAESDEFYRSSTVQLDGDRAPVTSTFRLRDLPPGEYDVTVVVAGVNGQQRAAAHTHVTIIESGASR